MLIRSPFLGLHKKVNLAWFMLELRYTYQHDNHREINVRGLLTPAAVRPFRIRRPENDLIHEVID